MKLISNGYGYDEEINLIKLIIASLLHEKIFVVKISNLKDKLKFKYFSNLILVPKIPQINFLPPFIVTNFYE